MTKSEIVVSLQRRLRLNKTTNQQNKIIVTTKNRKKMKVITSIQELEYAINELRAEAKSDKYYYRLYLVGEQTIREAISKYNLIVKSMKGLSGLFADSENNVQGLSLSGSELEFVDVAIIEGLTNSFYLAINDMFKVVKYKEYLLRPFKNSSEKTYHFEFLDTSIKVKVRTPKANNAK